MTANECPGVDANFDDCDTDAKGWRQVVTSAYNASGLSIPLFEGNCGDARFLKGVIDCKGGFEVDENFSNPQFPRLYASGTTGAHWTGDTYIGPGATIGLGMYSGRRISQTAIARARSLKRG